MGYKQNLHYIVPYVYFHQFSLVSYANYYYPHSWITKHNILLTSIFLITCWHYYFKLSLVKSYLYAQEFCDKYGSKWIQISRYWFSCYNVQWDFNIVEIDYALLSLYHLWPIGIFLFPCFTHIIEFVVDIWALSPTLACGETKSATLTLSRQLCSKPGLLWLLVTLVCRPHI